MDVELTFRTERARVTAGVILIKKFKKCQRLIWYTATRLSDRLTYNPTGVTLPCSLLAKCQRPTWILSYTVWYPQAALRDTAEVQRFKLTLAVSLKLNVQYTSVWTRCGWEQVSAFHLRANLYSYNMWFIRTSGLNHTVPQLPPHLYKWKKNRDWVHFDLIFLLPFGQLSISWNLMRYVCGRMSTYEIKIAN